jgi:nucleotide-binding universal stress UspA family protein
MRTVLVPLDGSPIAESILPYVQAFAHLTDLDITLLRVVEPWTSSFDSGLSLYAPLANEEQVASEYLAQLAERLTATGRVVLTRVVIGRPADIIVDIAPEFDLIAMATHGRSGIGRWAYGSVADKVLRSVARPVLLLRARPDEPMAARLPHRILVPLDGSVLAEQALPLAADLAGRGDASLILCRSITRPRDGGGVAASRGSSSGAASTSHSRVPAEVYLASVSQHLTRLGLAVTSVVGAGPAADTILACADEQQAELIVMTTHGRGGLGRWVFGSVADRVLRGAPIPILLVRASLPVDTSVAQDTLAS